MLWPIPEYDERDYKVSNGIWTIIKLLWIIVFTWIAMDWMVNGSPIGYMEESYKRGRIVDEMCLKQNGYNCGRFYR